MRSGVFIWYVIARSASDEAIQVYCLDCFASLAMTRGYAKV